MGYAELPTVTVWELGNDKETTKLNQLMNRNALYTVAYDMKNAISTVGYLDFTITNNADDVKQMYYDKNFDVISRKKKYAKKIEISELEENTFKVTGTNFYFKNMPTVNENININKYALMTFWCGCFLIDLYDKDELPICISDSIHLKLLQRYKDTNSKTIIYKY